MKRPIVRSGDNLLTALGLAADLWISLEHVKEAHGRPQKQRPGQSREA